MPKFFINAFYESKFRDNLFVIKAGGKIIEDEKALSNLAANIQELTRHGIKVLMIYGGGQALDSEVEKRGIGVKRENGRRITDANTLDIMKEVVGGRLSLSVYKAFAERGVEALNLNAVPADWMDVLLRPKKPVDYGLVGDIHGAMSRPIKRLFKTVNIVTVPCLAWAKDAGKNGGLVNINADTIATELAIGLKAHKLIFLSDVDGVQINGEVQGMITADDIDTHIASGAVTGGMKVKLENCKRALSAGVSRIHLINGLRDDALKKEIYEPIGPGTMLIQADDEQNYLNEIEAQKLIEQGQ